ncbi:protease modulator HflC [Paracoccus aestuarii]|uniref:Protease modulator HflC n=1 Tax=Paracoccus aestuarii TaxID=453842 RepID=A0A419A1Q9_9RHOB|nr:SPFH domain-containing protein [Paracoccus aestuarii]RJL06989.1 protease modulator HflC [Paracoccus aestuarii]WCR00503.1 protease modulator HflC [Paracoccus aestuarii]
MAGRKTLLGTLAIPAVVAVAVVVASSLFIVDEREKALVLRLGRVVDVQETPGLNFKLPFVDNVVKYDGRILGLPTSPLEVTPLDDRRLVVDAFARFRITDPVRFRQAVGVQGVSGAQMRLEPIVRNAIREVLGTVPSTAVLSDDRTSLMNQIRNEARNNSAGLGIEIIDVRLTRTDLPEQNLNATYARMRAERAREAADEVARGNEAAQRVRAAADRTVVELTSEAQRRSEIVRGEADAQRNAIYADAYGRDPEFFAFTRSLTSYQRALRGDNSSLVLQPNSEFFTYLSTDGAADASPASTPVPAGNSAERLGLELGQNGGEEQLVSPELYDSEGNRIGESAGVELTPLPESLATPPQEEGGILQPESPVDLDSPAAGEGEAAPEAEPVPAPETPVEEVPTQEAPEEPVPAN